jgi:hypothetical protein
MTKLSGFQRAKEIGMKKARRTAPGLATLGAILTLLLTASAARAQAPPPNCSQATLSGTYVLSGNGIMGGVSVATRGKVTYDGHGNGQATFTQSTGGYVQKFVAAPGVYTVNTDCTGSKTFGGTTNYDFVVTPDGREITWIVTNAGAVFTGNAVRLDSSGALHVTKECSQYTGKAGGYCTITSSNLAAIKVGSQIIYEADQTANSAAGFLSTDVFLDAGAGNMAVGHCTVDAANFGLCTFSDGTGQFTGFQARVAVSGFSTSPSEVNYHWDGTYSFTPQPVR